MALCGGLAIFLAAKLGNDFVQGEVQRCFCIERPYLTAYRMSGTKMSGTKESKLDGKTVTCTACLLFCHRYLNTSRVINKTRQALYFPFDVLTEPRSDICLLT